MQAKPASPWHADAFKEALKQLRHRLDVKQAELAQWAGVSPPQISRWVAGASRPGHDTLRRMLAAAIAQDPDDGTVRRLADAAATAAGYPGLMSEVADETAVSPYSGQVWRMVETLQRRAQEAGLSPEEEQEMIARAMETAEKQAEMAFDADLMRRERERVEDQT